MRVAIATHWYSGKGEGLELRQGWKNKCSAVCAWLDSKDWTEGVRECSCM